MNQVKLIETLSRVRRGVATQKDYTALTEEIQRLRAALEDIAYYAGSTDADWPVLIVKCKSALEG